MIEKYPEEYKKALELPKKVQIAKKDEKKGVVVFCKANDWFRLKMLNQNGDVISADDWEILKILECKPEEEAIKFDLNKLHIIEEARVIFEKEANNRARDRINIINPTKKEFEKLVEWLKRKEPENIKRV